MEPPRSLMPRHAQWTSSLWTRPSFSTCPIPGAHDWTGTRPLPPSFNQGPFLNVYGCCVVYIGRTRDASLDTPKDISIHFCGILPLWHGRLNCFLNLTLVLHLNRRDNRVYLKSWKPVSAGDDGKPSFLLIGWHLFKELCNLVASMDIWLGKNFFLLLWVHSWKLQDVPRENTALWCKQVCSGSLPFLSFSLSLSLGLSLSSYFFLSALLLCSFFELGAMLGFTGGWNGPKQECNI